METLAMLGAITLLLVLMVDVHPCLGTRSLTTTSSYQSYSPTSYAVFKYYNGALLAGDIPVSVVWYGKFTPTQKSIMHDFLLSLTPRRREPSVPAPSVSQWWQEIDDYLWRAGKVHSSRILLAKQVTDYYSVGKYLDKSAISALAARAGAGGGGGGITVVLTADDVAVEGFCVRHCGFHSSRGGAEPFVWVGNSAAQCPGQCAWPFHQPIYGPQGPPLVAPNGDVGVDGMVINLATLLAGAATNPFGNGYFQGPKEAPVEVAAACPGVYGKGAYPGYAGELLLDSATGGSYNAHGMNGRKYLLPAVFDASTSSCSTLV